jgi:hypothetical protein
MSSTRSRADSTLIVWRLLCLLALTSGLVAVTPLWSLLPPLWQGIASIPGLVVMLLVVVASWADWSTSRSASTMR